MSARACSRCAAPTTPTLALARNGHSTRRTLVSSCCAAPLAGVAPEISAHVRAVLERTPVVPYTTDWD